MDFDLKLPQGAALFSSAVITSLALRAASQRVARTVRRRRQSTSLKESLADLQMAAAAAESKSDPSPSPEGAGSASSKPKKSTLYTRTGDAGESSLYNAERRRKDDEVFQALGAVDELNAHLGLAAEHCEKVDNGLQSTLREVQSRLIDIGAAVGTPRDSTKSSSKLTRTTFADSHVEYLEGVTDELDGRLPALKNFILAGGGLSASHLHVARTVCRRAERRVVPLVRDGQVEDSVSKYLNRLSDMLFAAARYAASFEGKSDVVYRAER